MTLSALIRSPSGIVVLETILLACLMFGTFSLLVRVTDMETVGLWVLVNALLGFSRAADFWSRGLASFVGEARGKGEDGEAAGFVSTAVLSGLAGYAVLALLGAGAIWLFAEPLAGKTQAPLVRGILPLMGVTFWLLAIAGIYGGAFLAFGRPVLKAAQTVGGAAVFLILAVILAPTYGLWGILAAQALQGGLMLAYAAGAFHYHLARGLGANWRMSQFRLLASYGSKAIVVGTLQLAIEPVIRLLASQFGGLGAVAAVELASRLIFVVRSVITALGQILVPEFARLGASAQDELDKLYSGISRLVLLTSISAFSLLASAAHPVEEFVLGRTGTGFVGFLWVLSIGWFANTVTSPAYFLLLSRRRLRVLLIANLIMTLGAIGLGAAGGILFGVYGAMAGATIALGLSSLYVAELTGEREIRLAGHGGLLRAEPARLLPLIAAATVLSAVELSGLLAGDAMTRIAAYGSAMLATMMACLVFGDIRGLIRTAARVEVR